MLPLTDVKIHTLKDGRKLVNLLPGPVVFSDGTVATPQIDGFSDKLKVVKKGRVMRLRGVSVTKISSTLEESQLSFLRSLQDKNDIVLTPRCVLDALLHLGNNQREEVYYKCLGQKAVDEKAPVKVVDVTCWVY